MYDLAQANENLIFGQFNKMKDYDILIGTPVHCQGAYALDKFLANQKEIQARYPSCELIFSTNEPDFASILDENLNHWQIKGKIISYKTEKPDYAKSRLWNIACGREAIRKYVLTETQARVLLFLDADMTYDPEVINILKKEAEEQDAVFCGYRFKNHRIGLTGAGCLWLSRKALEMVKFRCYEFKNGQVLNEDNILEMDLYRQSYKIKKGFFLAINHYFSASESRSIKRQKLGIYRRLSTNSTIRYYLIRASVALHFNIPSTGQKLLWKLIGFLEAIKNNISFSILNY